MEKLVKCIDVNGEIAVPASKSIAQRAIIAAMLAEESTYLCDVSLCDDTKRAIDVAKTWGAEVREMGADYLIIPGAGGKREGVLTLFCGESGLLTRMIVPVAALLDREVVIMGSGSVLKRPMQMLVSPLRELGVNIRTCAGGLPITLCGPLRGGECRLDGSISSQIITGFLMALPLAERDSILYVENLKSKPYIDMTLSVLEAFGIEIEREGYRCFKIRGRQAYHSCIFPVEGDWSGASCFLVAGALAGKVKITNLNINSTQADRQILEVLRQVGAEVLVEPGEKWDSVTVSHKELRPFECEATDSPDLFPALVALASGCTGTSRIRGAHRLVYNESNRIESLQEEFAKMGIRIEVDDDTMLVTGGVIKGGEVSSRNDHRVAMALATAALRSSAPVIIAEAEVVSKSYPTFWSDFLKL